MLSVRMRGADHTKNTFYVVLYNYSPRTTAENTASLLLCDVTSYVIVFSVRWIATVRARTTENTAPVLLASCVVGVA
jgi:hypothetical protein